MKRRCLISRLDEPNIAHLYVIETDQNLINNIRVLCTRHPETLRFFVPERLFLEIRNGEPVAMTAECFDEYGRKLFTVDPLKVLSEQLREADLFSDEGEELDLRLRVEGYPLPQPEGEQVEFLARPEWYRRSPESAGSGSRGSRAGSGSRRAGSSGSGYSGNGSGRGYRESTATRGRNKGNANGTPVVDPSFRKRKKSPVKAILLALVIMAAAAGIWFLRDTSVKRFEDRMSTARYAEAVIIYNKEILGHEVREERADPQVKDAVESVREDYLSEQCSYEDACANLDILTGIEKEELAQLAQSALEEVKLYEVSSSTLRKGASYMENGDYLKAIESFLQIEESSSIYGEAQEDLKNCIGLLIGSAEASETETEWLEAIALIDSALELLPDNEELTKCREASVSKYQALVRSNAITEADELAVEGDYAGAFARIGRALEILPEDEQLTQKDAALRKAFVSYITINAVDSVNSGDFESAYGLVDEALEIYSCDELNDLYAQIEDGESGAYREAVEYTAEKVAFTEYPGAFKDTVVKQEHAVKATAGGPCCFVFGKMDAGLKVQLLIKGPDGTAVVTQTGLVEGSEVNCSLEKDKTYTVEVSAVEGQGNYVLRFGQQKAAADITDYDLVRDSMEFKNQSNTYYFVPENSGGFRFDLTSDQKETALKVSIYDPLGGEIFGGDMTDGGGVTVELTAGEKYRIDAAQSGKTGNYTIAIGKQEPSEDITGKCIVPGAIRYAGQKKAYTFKAAESGQYRFTVGNMEDGCSVKLYVYSQLGEKLAGTNSLGSGEAVSAELKEGQGYQVQITQQSGIGEYTLTIVKE